MSDLLMLPAVRCGPDAGRILGSINLAGQYDVETTVVDGTLLAVSHRHDAPVPAPRLFENERWTVVFAGDVIEESAVPFQRIISSLASQRRGGLAELNGIFAIAAHDKEQERSYAVSDRRSQKPLFHGDTSDGPAVSTNLAAFVRIGAPAEFDEHWLWQSLYFNFSVDDTTFLRNVKRVPPGSVLTFDRPSGKTAVDQYAGMFRPRGPMLRGDEALRRARDVFARRLPRYYHGAMQTACALTAGWDGRTMLALAPRDADVTAYTYGTPGCDDLVRGAAAAKAIGARYIQLPFDEAFVDDLPRHACETVYQSGGMQNVVRSTLRHAYDLLADGGKRFPLTISGISFDSQFRGHLNRPHRISPELARLFEGDGDVEIDGAWQTSMGGRYREFSDFIRGRLERLQGLFGPFEEPLHHLSYALYPASTSYFSGELATADHYTTLRVPSWDTEVIELAYSIEPSMLSYSQYLKTHTRGERREKVLQAHVFKYLAPACYRVPVDNNRPAAVLAGEIPYRLDRAWLSFRSRMKERRLSKRVVPPEDWKAWLFGQHEGFLRELLRSPDTLVTTYLEPSFIESTITSGDVRQAGKLLSAEVILRLIKSGWQKFW